MSQPSILTGWMGITNLPFTGMSGQCWSTTRASSLRRHSGNCPGSIRNSFGPTNMECPSPGKPRWSRSKRLFTALATNSRTLLSDVVWRHFKRSSPGAIRGFFIICLRSTGSARGASILKTIQIELRKLLLIFYYGTRSGRGLPGRRSRGPGCRSGSRPPGARGELRRAAGRTGGRRGRQAGRA